MRLLRRIGVPIAVLLVMGLFGVGRLAGLSRLFAGDLKEPTTLSGLPRITDPTVADLEKRTEKKLEDENSGDALMATYGKSATNGYVLVAQRVRVDIDREMRDAGISGLAHSNGHSECASAQRVRMCLRTSRGLSVMVLGSGSEDDISRAVDEAWDAV